MSRLANTDEAAAFAAFALALAAYVFRDELLAVAEGAAGAAEGVVDNLTDEPRAGDVAVPAGKWVNPDPARRSRSIARGIRNNNPGNVKLTGDVWLGSVPRVLNSDGTFVQFGDMAHGIRAAIKLLRNYRRRYGLKTARAIIERYAPPGRDSNPVDAYRDFIARQLGVGLDDELPDTPRAWQTLARSIFDFENGGQMPTERELSEGFELAGVA